MGFTLGGLREIDDDEATEVLRSYDFGLNRTLVNEDEPAHMARRRALMGSFAPEHLAEHEPMVRRLTRELRKQMLNIKQEA